MVDCKQEVLEEIDAAMAANRERGICACEPLTPVNGKCYHCTIKEALERSRACIVASVDRTDVMIRGLEEMQNVIEWKLQRLLRIEQGKGGKK